MLSPHPFQDQDVLGGKIEPERLVLERIQLVIIQQPVSVPVVDAEQSPNCPVEPRAELTHLTKTEKNAGHT